jgi:hypothetical protein
MNADLEPNVTSVAELIAGKRDKAAPWLIAGLEHFRAGLDGDLDHEYFHKRMKRMLNAIAVLEKDLPAFLCMPFVRHKDAAHFAGYKNAAVALGTLPAIKDLLETALSATHQSGRKRNIGEEVCVTVIAECWKLVRGSVQGRSLTFMQTCDDYWRVCGHKGKGDPENWRRVIKRVSSENYEPITSMLAIRPILLGFLDGTE